MISTALLDLFTSNEDDFNWPLCYFIVFTGVVVYFVQECVENKMRPAFLGMFLIGVVVLATGQQDAVMKTPLKRLILGLTGFLFAPAISQPLISWLRK